MSNGTVNKVVIIGNLGADPEVRYLPDGNAVANCSVATSESWTDQAGERQERTEWHRVTIFRRLAEICGEYLRKGHKVYFEGKLVTRKWTDKDGIDRYTTEIIADEMQMLSPKEQAAGGQGYNQQGQQQGQQQQRAPQGQQQQRAPQGQQQQRAPQGQQQQRAPQGQQQQRAPQGQQQQRAPQGQQQQRAPQGQQQQYAPQGQQQQYAPQGQQQQYAPQGQQQYAPQEQQYAPQEQQYAPQGQQKVMEPPIDFDDDIPFLNLSH